MDKNMAKPATDKPSMLQQELASFKDPEPSELFVRAVMGRLETEQLGWKEQIQDFLRLPEWVSAAACVLCVALIIGNILPVETVSTESLLMSEISDEALFVALVDSSQNDVTSYYDRDSQ